MSTAGPPDPAFDPDDTGDTGDTGEEAYTPRPREAWVAGRTEASDTGETALVTHPADDTEVATVALPSREQTATAVEAAVGLGRLDDVELRTGALQIAAGELDARREELAELITAESGIPLRWAEREVDDAVAVLQYAARHPLPGEGRVVDGGATGATTLIHTVPRGPVLAAVSPQAPLRSAAHAVAAAFAVGAPVIVAAGVDTPLSALALGEALGEVGLPGGAFSVLPGTEPTAALESEDLVRLDPAPEGPMVALSAAMGPLGALNAVMGPSGASASGSVGAAVVVTDLPGSADDLAERIAVAATRQGGLRPEAVRRAVVCAPVADEFLPALTSAIAAQPTGNAYDTTVSVGALPVETVESAAAWLDDVVSAGATVLTGGTAGEPTLVTGTESVPTAGPVLAVTVVDEPEEALAAVGTGGAAASAVGLFTGDPALALRARAQLDAARVVVGAVPDYDPAAVHITIHTLTTPTLTHLH
ncbi:aldehyde dehydrogenase family protein [Saccharomonospora sp. CUA-673]|uniref:aldehyde dehydrogenase family protein n=1 Tax=Saccharomonospora sp. CUA-673 TaxID=1904969 RepID=UPI0009F960E2|nr:aldehyde dehydrogenase family protein [Saccharomonospora sp. CUA-673]